jgi:hypothetical protein
MDILLLVITVVSLIVALVMGIAAWGMWREERARSAARVATLTAAAHQEPHMPAALPLHDATVERSVAPLHEFTVERTANAPVPLHDVAADRSAAAAVSLHEPLTQRSVPSPRPAPWAPSPQRRPAAAEGVRDAFLGSAVAAPASGTRQRGLAIAASILFVAIVTGGYFSVYGKDGNETASAASNAPLELLSLRHERQNGALAITGLVRNPSAGHPVGKLAAVVLLFNQQGEFVTSSRAGVDYTQLAPGDESPFVIRVDAPSNVARYRVSFRTDDGVVPHVDRRGQEPIARDLP